VKPITNDEVEIKVTIKNKKINEVQYEEEEETGKKFVEFMADWRYPKAAKRKDIERTRIWQNEMCQKYEAQKASNEKLQ